MRIVCVSDTHSWHNRTVVPDGDILVHGGDLTRQGSLEDVEQFNEWLGMLPHRHKVVICGNHDFCFQTKPTEARARITNGHYLEDSRCEIEGLRFYGSPWQPWFGGWAFNLETREELAAVWAKIPPDTDVLLTHGPPAGILDLTRSGTHAGCQDLLARVFEVKPRLHVFGHIHEAVGWTEIEGIRFVNASTNLGNGTGLVVDL